jgi:hypothetical protein
VNERMDLEGNVEGKGDSVIGWVFNDKLGLLVRGDVVRACLERESVGQW